MKEDIIKEHKRLKDEARAWRQIVEGYEWLISVRESAEEPVGFVLGVLATDLETSKVHLLGSLRTITRYESFSPNKKHLVGEVMFSCEIIERSAEDVEKTLDDYKQEGWAETNSIFSWGDYDEERWSYHVAKITME